MVYYITRFFVRIVLFIFCRRPVYGREHMIEEGGALFVSNHASFLDPPVLGSAYRNPIYALARDTLFKGVHGWFFSQLHAVPVARGKGDMAGLKRVIRLVQEGKRVLLFPEGTRTEDGSLLPAEAGVGFLIARSGVPVQPIRIFGTFEAWPRHRKFPKPHPLGLVVGPAIDFSDVGKGLRGRAMYQAYADKVMEEIAALKMP